MKLIKSLAARLKKTRPSLLQFLVLVYLYLIPIWPKLPMVTIEYTYVAIRYEDFFVALVVGVFIIQLIFGKIKVPKNIYSKLIVFYWLVAVVSALIGYYYFRQIPDVRIGLLHAFRRVEYMIMFFVGMASITKVKHLRLYLNHLMVVLLFVSIYGIGQKFWGWPAIQTMNPHYSKGYLLTLDANARVSSTFGGHYDFAAFLVLTIPLALGLFLAVKKNRYFIVFLSAIIALILTASRASYIAYWLTVPLYLLVQKKFRLLLLVIALTLILTPLSNNLSQRINRTFRQDLVWISKNTGEAIVPREITADDLPPGDYIIKGNLGNKTKKQTPEQVKLVKNELRKNILEKSRQSGKILSQEELNRLVEEAFLGFIPVASVLPDISFATRLQVEWPRAIASFLKNPLTGTGTGSITEATDNDYLRALGETGALGFGLLMVIFAKIQLFLYQKGKQLSGLARPLFWGLLCGNLALLINALYIDVFEASKVALILWLIWGMFYRLHFFSTNEIKKNL